MPKFVPRQRKHRVIARQQDAAPTSTNGGATTAGTNPNALEVLPSTAAERDARKQSLKASLQASQPKMSSKKRKRLDKYVDTKLRKEDTLALIKRLEEKQKGVDRSLLQSAKKLGRQAETKREVFERALREKEKGVRIEEAESVLFARPKEPKRPQEVGIESESEGEGEDGSNNGECDPQPVKATIGAQLPQTVSTMPARVPPSQVGPTSFGSGLKRPLELDEEGRPIIKKRKRTRGAPLVFDTPAPTADAEQLEWTGFSDEEDAAAPARDLDHESDEAGDLEAESSVVSEDDGASMEGSAPEDESDAASEGSATKAARKARTSAFKAWAEQQRNETIDFAPSSAIGDSQMGLPVISDEIKKSFVPRAPEQDPLPESLTQQSAVANDRRAYAVPVQRTDEIQTARLALPVLAEEQRIMEAIFHNDVVIVSGATGSGKTTQVPQFLFEYGFGDPDGPTPGVIGVTQPRRVAAVSMAKRVGEELGDKGGSVAHQIRFDSTVGKGTAIKFMTDGVLLREMSEDFSLRKYSVIIIDEAHERTVNTDILISLMSRCVTVRRQLAKEQPKMYTPLKLIMMSATLRVEDFRANSRLFTQPPPIVEAEGRQYGVTIHWSRKTSHDFVEEAFKKVSRGHRKLPPGGMLVFLTGQNEIRQLMRRLKDVFQATDERNAEGPKMMVDAKAMVVEAEDLENIAGDEQQDDIDEGDEEESGDEGEPEDPDAEFLIEGEEPASALQKIHILPLYSQLASKDQLKVFQPAPTGSRLIILATNVAETSLTIPGIRYVFDCGRHKQRTWDRAGVQTFRTMWISKASADQRMGRAGRTGPGHCWRLYSSAVYEDAMAQWAEPEIVRAGLEGVVLQLKGLGVERVQGFPWPTPPERGSIIKAERLLRNLGALDAQGGITSVGRELQRYPLSPRFAQMLRLGVAHGVAREVIAVVAALDVPEIIVPENQLDLHTPARGDEGEEHIWTAEDDAAETAREARRHAYAAAMARFSRLDFDKSKVRPQADAVKVFAAVLDYASTTEEGGDKEKQEFCGENFVRDKGMCEAQQLREQLTRIVRHVSPNAVPTSTTSSTGTELKRITDKTIALLKQIIAAGFIDQIAIRADQLPSPPIEERKAKRAIDVKYKTLLSTSDKDSAAERASLGDAEEDEGGFVYIHPSSLLARLPPNATPRYIIYQDLQRSQPSRPGANSRVRMHPLTPVSGEQISVLARGTGLLEVGKPIGRVEVLPRGDGGEERRECDVLLSLRGNEAGEVGWVLCRKRVVQRRGLGKGWEVEVWK